VNVVLFPGHIGYLKTIILAVVGVLAFVLIMPVVAVASVTNIAALASPSVTLYTGPTYAGDLYDYGQCTYWAALRRSQVGRPVPGNWGNADTWASRASASGFLVDHSPSVGAVMQTTAGEYGHVAYVESVSAGGSWTISEMNFKGWDEVDARTFTAADDSLYNFIH
jgi:surface antigen